MKNLNILGLAGGIVVIVGSFLTWGSATIMEQTISVTGMDVNSAGGKPGIFTIVLGVLMAIFSLFGKKWSNITAMIFSLLALGIGALKISQCSKEGLNVGIGLYLIAAFSVIAIIGCFMGMRKKA